MYCYILFQMNLIVDYLNYIAAVLKCGKIGSILLKCHHLVLPKYYMNQSKNIKRIVYMVDHIKHVSANVSVFTIVNNNTIHTCIDILMKFNCKIKCCCCLPTPLTLVCVGSPIIPFWSTSQVIPPSGQQLHHSSGVSPLIEGDNAVRMWVQLKRRCVSCL